MTTSPMLLCGSKTNPNNGNHYRFARRGDWMAVYYPDLGGTEAYVRIPFAGWVVDVHDEMPHETWIELLESMEAPIR